MTTDSMTPADLAAVCGNTNEGFGGGVWWIIILFLFAFCGNGWNNGNNGGSSVKDQYVLSSDFATVQRQLSDGFNMLERKGDTINNGLCDGFYAQNTTLLNGFNGVNTAILTTGNGLQGQIAQCCCDVKGGIADIKYAEALNAKDTQQTINTGFCQTNFNNQNNTRDIIAANDANTRAILDAIQANKVEALKDRISEQNQMINSLNLAASQARQNEYLIDRLNPNPCPKPAYVVQPPTTVSFPTNCCGQAYSGGCA